MVRLWIEDWVEADLGQIRLWNWNRRPIPSLESDFSLVDVEAAESCSELLWQK